MEPWSGATARSWISGRLRPRCLRGNQKEVSVWLRDWAGENFRLEIKT